MSTTSNGRAGGNEYRLLVRFDTDEPEFARGFEAGQLWAELGAMPGPAQTYRRTIHAPNVEMVRRMAPALHFAATFEETEYPEWVDLLLERAEGVDPQSGLRLIPGGLGEEKP